DAGMVELPPVPLALDQRRGHSDGDLGALGLSRRRPHRAGMDAVVRRIQPLGARAVARDPLLDDLEADGAGAETPARAGLVHAARQPALAADLVADLAR